MAKKESMDFSIFELFVNDSFPKLDFLKSLVPRTYLHELREESLYIVNTETYEEYFWLDVSYGFSHPLPEEIIDKADGNAFIKNPRKDSQVEPSRQIFGLYIPKTGFLLLSSSKCKTTIGDLLSYGHEEKILIKHVLIDPEEFLRNTKILSTIEIAAKDDLLVHTTDLFKSMQDDLGCESPESFYLKATFEKSMTPGLRKLFGSLNGERRYGNIKRFVCAGRDEQGLETVFNADTFTRKVRLKVNKGDNGLFDKNEVREELMTKLKELGIT